MPAQPAADSENSTPMSAPGASNALPQEQRRRRMLTLAAPALVLLSIVLSYLRFHEYSLLMPESLVLVGAAVLIGALVGAAILVRPGTLGPALTATVLCVYLFYQKPLTDRVTTFAERLAETFGDIGLMLSAIGLAIFFSIWIASALLGRHLQLIVGAMFGTIVASTLLLPTTRGGEPVESGTLSVALKDLPPVIHVILDEHIGLAGLPPDIPGSAEAEDAIRAAYRDFALFPRAYSRFAETTFSLASLMNGDRGEDAGDLVRGDPTNFAMERSAWFEELRHEGYAIKAYQTSWFDLCGDDGRVDACYTYPLFSPNAVQRTALPFSERLGVLGRKLVFSWRGPQMGPLAATEALDRFRADIANAPRGAAWILHLALPHFGYLYNADCSLAATAQWERENWGEDDVYTAAERRELYRQYLAQVICTAARMENLFAHLRAIGVYDEATIIVHGDHGSRIGERPFIHAAPAALTDQDLLDHYATLLAIKAPGFEPGIRDEPTVVQKIFADAFLDGRHGFAGDDVLVRTSEDYLFSARTLSFGDIIADGPAAGLRRMADQSGEAFAQPN
jgi:hypothetical protein